MKPRSLILLALALLLPVLPVRSQDSVPKLINYQGKLVQPSGQPVVDQSYKLRFTIYNKPNPSQAGDILIWGADYAVAVVGGQFNVVLGATGGTAVPNTPVIDIGFAFGSAERYLQIEILSSAGVSQSPPQVILPRQQLLSVPYAMNGSPTGTVVPWIGSGAAVAPVPAGWLLADGRTIGSTGSGADFANEAARTLFRLIWNSVPPDLQTMQNPDKSLVAVGNRGTSAEADFDAGRILARPDLRGRVAIGSGTGGLKDDQQRNLTSRVLGSFLGEEIHKLTESEMPEHRHTGTTEHGNSMFYRTVDSRGTGASSNHVDGYISGNFVDRTDDNWPLSVHTHNFTSNPRGGEAAHNIMQPSFTLTYLIKL